MSKNKLAVARGTEESVSQWTTGLKSVYQSSLAQNYTLHVNGKDYPCNEAVMHAALPDIPIQQWEDCFSTIGALHGGTDLIPQLLQYFCTCEISVSMDTLKLTLKACKILHLQHLQEACEQFLWSNLCPLNYISWLKFSKEDKF